mmetsp:Transcript_40429/g.61669  ORF Transcript_40429/g.61669 Transcript_40429/m.61669 type:complete len:105 (+) Transcript_40429:1513-1827(+)
MNIFRTLFICIVLGMSSICFTKDAQSMVLDPLERMIEKVKAMADDPLSAAVNPNAGIYSFAKKLTDSDVAKKQSYETEALEKAIEKTGKLLALGFGEAGGQIIC